MVSNLKLSAESNYQESRHNNNNVEKNKISKNLFRNLRVCLSPKNKPNKRRTDYSKQIIQ